MKKKAVTLLYSSFIELTGPLDHRLVKVCGWRVLKGPTAE